MDSSKEFAWIKNIARPGHTPDAIEAGRIRAEVVRCLAEASVRLAELSVESKSPEAQVAYAEEAARFAEFASLASRI